MELAEPEVSLRDYLGIIARRKWIIATAIIFVLVGAVTMTALQEPIYAADAQVLVEPRTGDTFFEDDPDLNAQDLERAVETEIQIIEGQQVRSQVRTDLGLDRDPPKANARAIGSTDIVEVMVRSADPDTAQLLADAYVRAYAAIRRDQAVNELNEAGAQLQETVTELQGRIDDLDEQIAASPPETRDQVAASLSSQREALVNQQATFNERLDELRVDAELITGGASVVKSAELPEDPVEPQPVQTAALALVMGLVLGLGAAFIIDSFDDSITTEDDIEAITTVPVLATVPVHPPPDYRPIALSEPAHHAVEIYRGLRTNVQFLGLDRPMRIIQVTSSLPGEGKTTTASNLAVVLAQAGHKAVLVDADLRRPRLHELFAISQRPGLTDLLFGDPIDLVLSPLADGLTVVTSGAVPPNPSEMLASDRTRALLRELAGRFDYVIVDSPPMLPVSDALALATAADGVLFVTQARRASQRNLAEALRRIERVAGRPVGMILNQAKSRRGSGTYGYGYGYGYEYGTTRPEGATANETVATPSGDVATARRRRGGSRNQ